MRALQALGSELRIGADADQGAWEQGIVAAPVFLSPQVLNPVHEYLQHRGMGFFGLALLVCMRGFHLIRLVRVCEWTRCACVFTVFRPRLSRFASNLFLRQKNGLRRRAAGAQKLEPTEKIGRNYQRALRRKPPMQR